MGVSTGTETVTIYGRTIVLRNETRRVDQLRLNPNNPRLGHESFVKGKTLTEDDLQKKIWAMDATKKLYQTVFGSGGIQNPLYVKESGLVIEGSRRTVVALQIKANVESDELSGENAARAREIINNIPVKVLPNDVSDKEIDILLAREHISGKHKWPAVDQAKHIYKMHNIDAFPIETIAEVTERSRPWVYQKLKAFEWTEKYLRSNPKSNIDDYSYFEELYKKATALKKQANFDPNDPDDLKDFHRWISAGKIPMAIDIRKLPAVLTDPDGRKVLESDGVEKAWIVTKTRNPRIASSTFQALATATEALQKIPRDEYLDIPQDTAKRQMLFELYNEIDKVLKDLNLR